MVTWTAANPGTPLRLRHLDPRQKPSDTERLTASDATRAHAEILEKAEAHTPKYERLVARYSNAKIGQFTPAGAEAWYRLTRVGVAGERPAFPIGFLVPHSGASLAKAQVKRAASKAPAPHKAFLGTRQVVELAAPSPLLEAGLDHARSRTVAAVYDRIASLEAGGVVDQVLVPRDTEPADPMTRAVLGKIYRLQGKKPISLSEVRALLPKAIAGVFRASPARHDPALLRLYTDATNESIARLGQDFAEEVWSAKTDVRTFFSSRGCDHRQERMLRQLVPSLFGTPSPEVIEQLFSRTMAGKLSARGFYSAIGLQREAFLAYARGRGGALAADALSMDHLPGSASRRREGPRGSAPTNRRPADDPQRAAMAGKIARSFLERRPVAERHEVVAAINADRSFLDRFGRLELLRYGILSRRYPDDLPKTRKGNRAFRIERLSEVADRILEQRPTLTKKGLIEAMKAVHPGFDHNWLTRITPHLAHRIQGVEEPGNDAAADAERLALLLKTERPKSLVKAAESLGARDPRFTYPYVRYLADYHLAQSPATASLVAESKRVALGQGVAPLVRSVLEVLARVLPPGTDAEVIAERANELLIERGVPAQPLSRHREWLASLATKPMELHARTLSEVVAEYALTEKKGRSHEEVLAKLSHDYDLSPKKLGMLRHYWEQSPEKYPALAPFRAGEGFDFKGRDRPPSESRYYGGWDFARVAQTARGDEIAELARLSQKSRLRLHVPLLDMMVDDLAGKKPFAKYNMLVVGHLLGQAYPFTHALRRAGAGRQGPLMMVSSPYGAVPVAVDAVRESGVDVRVPKLTEGDYEEEVEKALDELVARHRKNGRPIVVVDDGGLIATLLHKKPAKYHDILHAVRIVEQTTGGVIMAEKFDLKTPISTVARAMSKKEEAALIGRTVAAKALQALQRIGKSLMDKEVTIIGYGYVGEALAAALTAQGAKVTIVEKTKGARDKATALYPVKALDDAIPGADIVFGATGDTSVGLDQMRLMKNGATFASVSSKRREFAMKVLEKECDQKRVLRIKSPLPTLPTVEYVLDGKTLTALCDGWPLNFDQDIDSVPLEEIQITLAALFAGALHATRLRASTKDAGFLPLDRDLDQTVLTRYRKLREGKPPLPVSSLEDWADPLIALTQRWAKRDGVPPSQARRA